jgi:hypothetical protein
MRTRLGFIAALQLLLIVTLALAACDFGGSNTPTSNIEPTATATTIPTPNATPDPAAALALNPTGGETTSGLDMHIVGIAAISTQPYSALGIACDPGLVFASPNPTTVGYSPSDFQAIRDYVSDVPLTQNGYPIPDTQAPSTVRWLPLGDLCSMRLDVHNSGGDVTISAVGLQLTANPAPNTYHYAQLDPCSISPARFYVCGSSGQGPDDGYLASVSVGGGAIGDNFQGNIVTNDAGYSLPLFLPSGQTKSIFVRILPKDPEAPGAIYPIVPQLTVTDTATHVVTFSGLQQTLVFADKSQFSCYGLSGNSALPSSQIAYDPAYHASC